MSILSIYLLFGPAVLVCVATQESDRAVYSLDRPMSQSRTDKAELLGRLYRHPAIQDRLSPSPHQNNVNISVQILVKKVNGIDELTQIMDSFVHFVVTWHDPDLTWDPQEYSGLDLIQLDKEKIWYPILYVVNAGDSESFVVDADRVVSLCYNGTALYHTTKFLKSSCNLDLSEYPHDVQECQINIVTSVVTQEAWIVHGHILEADEIQSDVKGPWEIVNRSMKVGSTSRHSYVNVFLQLKRQALFYTVCLLLPMFATSLLTVFVFWIPPNAGEKVSFLVSIVLANTMMLNLLGDMLPHSINRMPKFLVFVVGVMIQNFLAFACTLVVIRKHQHQENQEALFMRRTCSRPGTDFIFEAPGSGPRSITSKNINYSTGKSCQRNLRKCSSVVSPELTKAAASADKTQPLSAGCFPLPSEECFPCRSKLKDCMRKVISVRACTLDKWFFVVFFFAYVVFTAFMLLS